MIAKSLGNFVDGKWIPAEGSKLLSTNPMDQSVIWEGRISKPKDLDLVIESASRASSSWSAFTVEQRLSYLKKFTELVDKNKEEISSIISREVGKPKWEALTEVAAVIGKLAPSIDAYQTRASDFRRAAGSAESVTKFFPYGVAVVISPINFPIHMANGHIMPALLAGNTVIWKPSELCPMVAEMLTKLWQETGIPAGVINLVHGKAEAAQYLIKSKSINAVLFTGSRKAGLEINRALAEEPWKIIALEMGGNSPLVVWDYNDIKTAIYITIQSAYITSGQRCSSARRLIIQRNNKDFLPHLATAIKKLKVSSPDERPEPYMGPMVSIEYANKFLKTQKNIISRGGKPIVKSEALKHNSALVSPGLIDVTNIKSQDFDEVFGPLLQVILVDTFEEAILEANRSIYGLAAGLVSLDQSLFDIFVRKVKAGVINWNQQLTGASSYAPFGGIKQSGNNRPSGLFSVDNSSYPVATMQVANPTLPPALPQGMYL